ncbi:MAG: YggS family pyridoxal phosphate-dependent enzyme [Bacillota bacterium]
MENNIVNNLKTIERQIAQAYSMRRADNGAVRLIAVSKNNPAEAIIAAHAAGMNCFGESRIQETRAKQIQIQQELEWHLIGHLQTNKAKQAVKCFQLIQSLDSERLVDALAEEAEKIGKVQQVLIQVNIANEPRKYGVSGDAARKLLEYALAKPSLAVRGLMTIVPFYDTAEEARSDFSGMNNLFNQLKPVAEKADFDMLSMGMSGDFTIAIEEGANVVRVGTAIFGERNLI